MALPLLGATDLAHPPLAVVFGSGGSFESRLTVATSVVDDTVHPPADLICSAP